MGHFSIPIKFLKTCLISYYIRNNLGVERIGFWSRAQRKRWVDSPSDWLIISHLIVELFLHKQPLLSNNLSFYPLRLLKHIPETDMLFPYS